MKAQLHFKALLLIIAIGLIDPNTAFPIINGIPVEKDFMTTIWVAKKINSAGIKVGMQCSAILLSENTLLTSAHCFLGSVSSSLEPGEVEITSSTVLLENRIGYAVNEPPG